MEIPKKVKEEIWEYCRLNDISNIDDFILKLIRQGFTSEKYGATPMGNFEPKKIEKIVEVIKEVPVEKIVTKIEYINDTDNENELMEKIKELNQNIFHLNEEFSTEKKIFSTKIEEMEKNFQKEIENKDKEIDNLKKEIEDEKKKNNKNHDIYGDERKAGWFGSNILKR